MAHVPDGVISIPAMTSEAERECYYRLAKQQNHHGFVIELGAWLGASTAWIAAGVRDSGVDRKAHVFDRFVLRPGHEHKAKKSLRRDLLLEFKSNLGPLLEYVVPHKGELSDIVWDAGNVSLLVIDAPKRVKAISPTLTAFADYVYSGTIIAWQDFCFSAAYDIVATCSRLGHKLEFVEAVPGCTVVLRVTEAWTKQEVSPAALEPDRWTPDEIEKAWSRWQLLLPPEMAANVMAGQAMFLCDQGKTDRANAIMREVLHNYGSDSIRTHWQRFSRRANFAQRYAPLFNELRGRL